MDQIFMKFSIHLLLYISHKYAENDTANKNYDCIANLFPGITAKSADTLQ